MNGVWYGTGEQDHHQVGYDLPTLLAAWRITLDRMAKWKFNTIRLAIFTDYPPPFTRIDALINLIKSYGMKVVLDYHWNYSNTRMFGAPAWYNFWRDMATYYKGNTDIAAFELWNEPYHENEWDPSITSQAGILVAQARCTDIIHAIDPNRIVVWGWVVGRMYELEPVINNYLAYTGYVVFDFHMYATSAFSNTIGVTQTKDHMNYVKSKGFGAWLGEMGRNDWDATVSWQQSADFILKAINMCMSNSFGFSLWSYRDDHGFPSGTYDTVLAQSNYSLIPTLPFRDDFTTDLSKWSMQKGQWAIQ